MPRKKKKTTESRIPSLSEIDWPALRKRTATVTFSLVVVALIVAWILGVPKLEAYASAAGQADSIEIEFDDRPAWMRGDLEAMLVDTALKALSGDPMQRDELVAVRARLLDSGWFDEIAQVRRIGKGLVHVSGTFVEPYAVVRDSDGDHLISPQGRLLPRSFPVGAARQFAAVTGARYRRPASSGVLWEGADVTAALRVLRLIDSKAWRTQIASVDVSRYLGEDVLSLVTDRGCRIIFGRPPGAESPGEVSAQQKIRYLDYHHEHYGHVDRGFPRDLDITGDVVIGH